MGHPVVWENKRFSLIFSAFSTGKNKLVLKCNIYYCFRVQQLFTVAFKMETHLPKKTWNTKIVATNPLLQNIFKVLLSILLFLKKEKKSLEHLCWSKWRAMWKYFWRVNYWRFFAQCNHIQIFKYYAQTMLK